jgi:hypothetical protein
MYNLKKWQTYSHTHRSFDFEETIPEDLVLKFKEKYRHVEDQFYEFVFIEDKSIIETIYDFSSLPQTDQFKFQNFQPRKNSQLLAPLVIIAVPKKYDHSSLALVGEIYSLIAHTAIKQGYQTGFCICYDNDSVELLLADKSYTQERRQLYQIPFLTIGHQIKDLPWNFQQRDVNMVIKSYVKIKKNKYITVD